MFNEKQFSKVAKRYHQAATTINEAAARWNNENKGSGSLYAFLNMQVCSGMSFNTHCYPEFSSQVNVSLPNGTHINLLCELTKSYWRDNYEAVQEAEAIARAIAEIERLERLVLDTIGNDKSLEEAKEKEINELKDKLAKLEA